MTASAMNPTRWRPRFPGIPSLDRVADCGNHPVNAECPHVGAEMCALVENLSTGLVYAGFGAQDALEFRRGIRADPVTMDTVGAGLRSGLLWPIAGGYESGQASHVMTSGVASTTSTLKMRL